jgi:hypothetical protein
LRLEKAQARELREDALVEGDLRGLIPELQARRGIESRVVSASLSGRVVATIDFVGEK